MRVLHVLPSVQGYGAERQIVELLASMRSAEIEPALATIYEPGPAVRDGLPFPVVSAARKNRLDLLFFSRLVGTMRSMRPDIVHTHTHVGKYWGRLAAVCAGIRRIVHTEHNPCDERRNAAERIADAVLHRATARVVTFFSEQAEHLRLFEGLPPEKVSVIPNGLHLPAPNAGDRAGARMAMGLSDGDFCIMVIGRMEFQKNQMLALRALAALPEPARHSCVLCFAGAGRDEEMLRGLARALEVEPRVRFLGYRNDVRALLAGADLVLMTSWFEGMPLALLEAMIAAVPILTTPWTGASNMLGNGVYGFIAPDYEPQSVADAIARVAAHPASRANVSRRAQQYVYAQYGISRMIERHRQLYLDVYREHAS